MNAEAIIGLENYNVSELESCIYNHLALLNENNVFEDLDFSVNQINFFGSRVSGNAREKSDLDVKLEYTGRAREDDLFNALNDENHTLYIEDIAVHSLLTSQFYCERRNSGGILVSKWLTTSLNLITKVS